MFLNLQNFIQFKKLSSFNKEWKVIYSGWAVKWYVLGRQNKNIEANTYRMWVSLGVTSLDSE